jgi:hypothetical protein
MADTKPPAVGLLAVGDQQTAAETPAGFRGAAPEKPPKVGRTAAVSGHKAARRNNHGTQDRPETGFVNTYKQRHMLRLRKPCTARPHNVTSLQTNDQGTPAAYRHRPIEQGRLPAVFVTVNPPFKGTYRSFNPLQDAKSRLRQAQGHRP